jgi:NADH:ubiquinone oxidoreductase subunit 6 (subunit J)
MLSFLYLVIQFFQDLWHLKFFLFNLSNYIFYLISFSNEVLISFFIIFTFFGIPVLNIVCLVVIFAYVALFYIVLGLEFLGLVLLIIYIGAIIVLFLFVVMLIPEESKNNLSFKEVGSLTYLIFVFFGPEYLPFCFTFINFFIWIVYVSLFFVFELGIFNFGLDSFLWFNDLSTFKIMGKNIEVLTYSLNFLKFEFLNFDHIFEFYGFVLYMEYWHLVIINILILLVAMLGPISLILYRNVYYEYNGIIFFTITKKNKFIFEKFKINLYEKIRLKN